MIRIEKCFAVKGGILVIVKPVKEGTFNVKKISAQLGIEQDGLVLQLEDYELPLPEDMFDYITENRLITICQVNGTHYLYQPTVTIELEKDTLIEAKAIYRYHKNQVGKKIIDKEL